MRNGTVGYGNWIGGSDVLAYKTNRSVPMSLGVSKDEKGQNNGLLILPSIPAKSYPLCEK